MSVYIGWLEKSDRCTSMRFLWIGLGRIDLFLTTLRPTGPIFYRAVFAPCDVELSSLARSFVKGGPRRLLRTGILRWGYYVVCAVPKNFRGPVIFDRAGGVFFTPIAELGDRYVLLVRSGAQTVRVLTRLVHDWLPRRVYSFLVRCSRPILVRCHCCFIRGRLLRCDAVTITTRAGITSTVGTTGTDLPIIAQTAASMGQKEPPHNSPSLLTERIGTKASCTKATLVMTSTDVETEQSERHGVKIVLITASICKLNYWREHHSVGTLHYTLWEISLCRPKHIGLCMLKVCRACYFCATSGL